MTPEDQPFTGLERGFRLRDWRILPNLNRATRDGETVQVEPRVMETLVYLAQHSGEVVTRRELMDALWGESVVVEAALTRAISELRNLLGDDSREPAYIETIRKSGYRLIVAVESIERAPQGASPAGPPADALSGAAGPSPSDGRPADSSRRRAPLALGIAALAIATIVLGIRLLDREPVPDGEPLRIVPLTPFTGSEISPALSPDGTRVAFLWPGEDKSGDPDLYVKQRGAETPLRLTETAGAEGNPVWSPDGRQIAFARALSDGRSEIFTIPAIGGEPRRVARIQSWPLGLDWSPDGQWMTYAIVTGLAGPDRIHRHSFATGESRPLTDPEPETVGDTLPRISPDGTRIAFARGDRLAFQDVFLVSSEGGEAERLTRGHRRVTGLAWAADGASLLVSSIPRGEPALWRVLIEDGTTSRVAIGASRPREVSTARGADALVYAEMRSETNIWVIEPGEGAEPSPRITSTRWDGSPALSPDGERIAFVSDRSGSKQVWTCRRDGSGPLRITSLESSGIRRPIWSPDGERIAITATADGDAIIHVFSGDGGLPRTLTAGDHRDVVSGWSRDGETLYFDSDRSGEWQVWKMPAEGGEALQVTREGGLSGRESPDGQWIYYVKLGSPGIWRMPVGGSDEEVVARYHSIGDCGNWTALNDGVAFATWGRTGPQVARYDFATGKTRTIAPTPGIIMSSLDATPAGDIFLYARTEVTSVDLMLVEPFR